MKVLILGGGGFLSGPMATAFRDAGHSVSVFTRGRRPTPAGCRALLGDRGHPETLLAAVEGRAFDAVVDCICYTPGDAGAALRAFTGRVGRYVLISTDFVYGPFRPYPMDEDTPTLALNQYGRDKAACEDILLTAYHDEGFRTTVLRPPHIMGAGGHLGTGSLHGRDAALLDRMEQGAPIVLLDGGQLLIQPAHHADIARACLAVLGTDATIGRAYNCAGPDVLTTRGYYDVIAATLGVAPRYESLPSSSYTDAFPEKAPFAQHRTYRTDRLCHDTGYRPWVTVQHAIFEMVDWLQSSGAALPYSPDSFDQAFAALASAYRGETEGLLQALIPEKA